MRIKIKYIQTINFFTSLLLIFTGIEKLLYFETIPPPPDFPKEFASQLFLVLAIIEIALSCLLWIKDAYKLYKYLFALFCIFLMQHVLAYINSSAMCGCSNLINKNIILIAVIYLTIHYGYLINKGEYYEKT